MSSSGSKSTYANINRRYQYCDSCDTLLPAPGFYCAICNPPEPPEAFKERGLSISQTALRIFSIILIFIAVVIFKIDIDPNPVSEVPVVVEAPLKIAEDEDYKIFFKVNVSFANLRDKPSSKKSTILFVLPLGTQVEVLEKKGKWSKVRSNPKPRQQSRTGWLASRLLDSEIK